jgi:hypothetical protein
MPGCLHSKTDTVITCVSNSLLDNCVRSRFLLILYRKFITLKVYLNTLSIKFRERMSVIVIVTLMYHRHKPLGSVNLLGS